MARNDPQFNLRISQELKNRLDIEARKSGRSITQEIIKRIERSLDEDEQLSRWDDVPLPSDSEYLKPVDDNIARLKSLELAIYSLNAAFAELTKK